MTLDVTIDNVIVCLIFIHQVRECCFDSRALLIDSIVQGIGQTIHGLHHFVRAYPISHLIIYCEQFLTVIYQVLKLDTFWMIQKEHI